MGRIKVIGLGNMGAALATNLAAAGHDVDSVTSMHRPAALGEVATQSWSRFTDARPGDDCTAVYAFTTDP